MMSANTEAVTGGALLDAALEHARAGRAVVPLHHVRPDGSCSCKDGSRCGTPGKHPRWDEKDLPNGITNATPDQEQIRAWWKRWRLANIGIATGRRSGFWVLDVDLRHAGDDTLAELEREHGKLPSTVEAVTGGGGRHICFALPDGFEVRNIQRTADEPSPLGQGLDLRGEGGLIVGAGSMHASGKRYEWNLEHHPDDTPFADCPAWLLERVKQATAAGENRGPAPPVPEKIPHGKQHSTLCSLAGTLRRRGMGEEEIFACLKETNARRCEKPGPEKNIRKIAESVTKYPPDALSLRTDEPPETASRNGSGFVDAELPGDADAPPAKSDQSGDRTAPQENGCAVTRTASDIEPEAVTWLWPGRIPAGKLTILDGDPGTGKSLITLDIAARVSVGGRMPDGEASELDGPGGVVLVNIEDGPADTIIPRLLAAGADLSRVHLLEGVMERVKGKDAVRLVNVLDLRAIEEAIKKADARLLIIDPLMAFIPTQYDAHKDQDTRAALSPLAPLAEKTGCAILVVRHLNKSKGGAAVYRGGGSIGIVGLARSAMLVAPHPWDPDGHIRILAMTKSNLAGPVRSLAYRTGPPEAAEGTLFRTGTAVVTWGGEVKFTADQLLSARPLSPERQEIIEALKEGGKPTDAPAIAEKLGKKVETVRRLLSLMADNGHITRTGTGLYVFGTAVPTVPNVPIVPIIPIIPASVNGQTSEPRAGTAHLIPVLSIEQTSEGLASQPGPEQSEGSERLEGSERSERSETVSLRDEVRRLAGERGNPAVVVGDWEVAGEATWARFCEHQNSEPYLEEAKRALFCMEIE